LVLFFEPSFDFNNLKISTPSVSKLLLLGQKN
jgi:hypothetical protein